MRKEEFNTTNSGQIIRFTTSTIIPSYGGFSYCLVVKSENSIISLSSPEEVDEFCELLQEKKKEIWK